MNIVERKLAGDRLAAYRIKYTDEDLLARIRDFYTLNGRIPLKREFNSWHVFATRFGSWNGAIKKAGSDSRRPDNRANLL